MKFRDNTRKVEINGHQEYWKGYFHKWADVKQGDKILTMALVESESGKITYVEPYLITFIDHNEEHKP